MKKKLAWCMMLAAILFTLNGCQSSHTQSSDKSADDTEIADTGKNSLFSESAYQKKLLSGRKNLKTYQTQYQNDVVQVQKNSYQRLNFEQCVFADLPDNDTVFVLDVGDKGLSVDESISVIRNWLADIGQENIDLEKQLRDASGQLERDDSQEYPYDYPSVMEHKEELTSGHGFFVNTNTCYIQMGQDGIYSMSDGRITEFLGGG